MISRDGGRTWDNFRLICFAPDGNDSFLQHSLTFVDKVGYLFYVDDSLDRRLAGKAARRIRLENHCWWSLRIPEGATWCSVT